MVRCHFLKIYLLPDPTPYQPTQNYSQSTYYQVNKVIHSHLNMSYYSKTYFHKLQRLRFHWKLRTPHLQISLDQLLHQCIFDQCRHCSRHIFQFILRICHWIPSFLCQSHDVFDLRPLMPQSHFIKLLLQSDSSVPNLAHW